MSDPAESDAEQNRNRENNGEHDDDKLFNEYDLLEGLVKGCNIHIRPARVARSIMCDKVGMAIDFPG